VVLLALASSVASATAPDVYVELAGSGGLGSVNLTTPLRGPVDLRVGLSLLPVTRDTGWVVVVPVMAEAHSAGRWQALGGIGLGPSITTKGAPWARGLLAAGVRYVPPDGRAWAGIAYTPLVSFLLDLQLQHWAGLQLGWRT
jgi:hypothetical protein